MSNGFGQKVRTSPEIIGDNWPRLTVAMSPVAKRKADFIGQPMGVVVRNDAGALAAVTDLGRVTWLDDCVAGPVGGSAQGAEPAAWVTPLAYGQQVTFYKPPKPEGFDDNLAGRTWYCRPLVYGDTKPQSAGMPEGYTPVRTETLKWLLGEGPTFEPPEWQREQNERVYGRVAPYWWRHHLRDAMLTATPRPAGESFQSRVAPWMQECFGPEISADKVERNHRFLEEALELVQSLGCTAEESHQLVDYVFGRPVGDPPQEVGGVRVTLAALCLAAGLDEDQCAETELARIWTKVEKIREKQKRKPAMSPLPGTYPERPQPPQQGGE